MRLKTAAWTAVKATIISAFLIAFAAVQGYAGYLHGLNSAPSPTPWRPGALAVAWT